jgi:hypothetical protein
VICGNRKGKRVKKLIAGSSMAGFREPSDFDPTKPSSLDLDRIRRVGPFKVCRNAKPFGMTIDSLINELVCRESSIDG